jgi:hypothetical protein
MAKTWILDTETKGTGAHIAPLPGKRAHHAAPEAALALVQLARPPRPEPEPEAPAQAPRFKLVDVPSGLVLGENLDAHATVEELAQMRSALDARVYVWAPERRRWRLLSLADTRALWRMATGARSPLRARAGDE